MIKPLVRLADSLRIWQSKLFVGEGCIRLCFYDVQDYFEFTKESDGSITFACENGDVEVAYQEGLDLNGAECELLTYGA